MALPFRRTIKPVLRKVILVDALKRGGIMARKQVKRKERLPMVVSISPILVLVGLFLAACSPMKPSNGRQQTGQVQFVLPGEALALLEAEPLSLRVRVMAVRGEETMTQEGEDRLFSLTQDQNQYQVEGVRLGMKEFQLTLVNAQKESIGDGKARALIRPGPQTLKEVKIHLRPADKRRRDLPVQLAVEFQKSGEPAKTSFREIAPLLDAHRCTVCHIIAGDDWEVDLKDFPFAYKRGGKTQAEIVQSMIEFMTADPPYRMPPKDKGPEVTADEIKVFQKWLDDGLLKDPPADDTGELAHTLIINWKLTGTDEAGTLKLPRLNDASWPFKGTLPRLIVGGAYEFEVVILGADDQVSFRATVSQVIDDSGKGLEKVIEVPFKDPTVTVPIVIQR